VVENEWIHEIFQLAINGDGTYETGYQRPLSDGTAMEGVLTFDLGATSMRAGLFDTNACPMKVVSRPSHGEAMAGDRAESDPETWWNALCEIAQDLLDDPDAARVEIKGIVITGMTRTQIFLNAEGEVIRPAITWRDARAKAEAARLHEEISSDERGDVLIGHSPISPYHPIARLMWVGENEPEVMEDTRWVLQPKDYLNYRLTGVPAGDVISSANYLDITRSRVPERLFRRLALDPGVIPPLHSPEAMVGTVQRGLPSPFDGIAGAAVFTGSMDTWCCTVGIGANRQGLGYNIAGTSEVLGILTERPAFAPGLVTVPWGDGLFQIGGPSQTGGDCLAWFAEAFAGSPDAGKQELAPLVRSLSKRPRDPNPPIFLPYLSGERTPLWDPDARGVFFGIDRSHHASDFLWAVLEGVAFANRHVLDLAEEAAGITIDEVRITGGGAQLDVWCQIKADVTGRDVVRTRQAEAGLFGAVLVALHGLGVYPNRKTVQARLVQEDKRFIPDAMRRPIYAGMYEIYRDLWGDLRRRFQALADVRNEHAQAESRNLRDLWGGTG
jgi:xylulokinase